MLWYKSHFIYLKIDKLQFVIGSKLNCIVFGSGNELNIITEIPFSVSVSYRSNFVLFIFIQKWIFVIKLKEKKTFQYREISSSVYYYLVSISFSSQNLLRKVMINEGGFEWQITRRIQWCRFFLGRFARSFIHSK